MSSDLNKRIEDLRTQLMEAEETKYRLTDELNAHADDGEYLNNLREDLAQHEEIHASTLEKIKELTELKSNLLETLDLYKNASTQLAQMHEDIAAAEKEADVKRNTLDENVNLAYLLEQQLDDIEKSHAMLAQELALAQANEEYVGGLQAKINETALSMEALSADLHEAAERKYELERDLFQALKNKQQLEIKLDASKGMADNIIAVEYQLMEVSETLEEEHDKLSSCGANIDTLKENIAAYGDVSGTNNELAICEKRIEELTVELLEARTQLHDLKESEAKLRDEVLDVLYKVEGCTNYNEIYALAEDFNKIGLAIHQTATGRTILCRYQDGKPVVENVVDDYIFLTPIKGAKRLMEGTINKIKSFVLANEGDSCTAEKQPVTIMNEDKKFSIDFLVDAEREL